MKNRVRPLTASPCPETALVTPKGKWRRLILVGAIAPASLALSPSASAADKVVPPSFSIVSDDGAPDVYLEGLQEGFVGGSNDRGTPNPFNSSPELTLRMGQSTAVGPDAWADNRTWIYTGQIFTGEFGTISFAANNDDFDLITVDGITVLDNNTWNVPNAGAATGLQANTWVNFEFRVGNGGGGAGPSAQNPADIGASGWNATTGVVFSYFDLTDPITLALPVSVGSYDMGRPEEQLGFGPTLFRYLAGRSFTDDLRVTGTGTITLDGTINLVQEKSLRFENAAEATLTVNDGTGGHKTLTIKEGTTLATNTAPIIVAGTSDVQLGRVTDSNLSGVRLVANGPGQLILDYTDDITPSDLNGTTIEVGATGRVTVRGFNDVNPVGSLVTPLTYTGAGGVINVGSLAVGQVYDNSITVTESGVLEHSTNTADTVGTGTKAITIAAGKTLTVKNSANTLTIGANATGATLINDSTSLVSHTGNVNVDTFTNTNGVAQLRGTNNLVNLNVAGGRVEMRGDSTITNTAVTAGRLELRGNYTLGTVPAVTAGATLAMLNPTNTGTVPAQFALPSGTLEIVPGSIGTSALSLTGGTVTLLPGVTGLVGDYYNQAANKTGNQNTDFLTREAYVAFFDTAVPTVEDVLTSVGETSVLSFNQVGANTAMFERYGFTATDSIISRMAGKINIPVTGTYNFTTRSDDGSVLFLNGTKVVDNNFDQGMTARSGSIFLTAGLHDIDIGFYEGGGDNGLEVFWAGPGIANTLLPNSILFPDAAPTTFTNAVNVQENSTINTVAPSAIINSLTVQPGKTLSTTGTLMTATTLTLNGTGAYTINTAESSTFTANDIASNGQPVNINKTGPGVLAIDDLTNTSPQLPTGSSITVSEGALGLLLGGATSPLGSAELTFNGGGVVLSSKAGNQNYAIPIINGNGSIEARRIASGVAGTVDAPINITLTGNLAVTPQQTITLGTADNYIINVGGTASGGGTVVVNGGTVIDTTGTGLQNLNLAVRARGGTGNLKINSNTVSLASLASDSISKANVTLGTGAGPVALTFTGAGSGRFLGNLSTAGATPLSIVKNGDGAQSLLGAAGPVVPTTINGVTLNAGILEISPTTLGNAPINLAGGTLQMSATGLILQAWEHDPNDAALNAYGTNLDTFAGVQTHYAALGTPAFVGNTAANDNLVISYNPGGGDATAPFAIHGYSDLDTIEALFTGKIYIPTAGNYKFSPRSDDGTTVYINGAPISLNNVGQGINEDVQAPRDGTVALTAGYHDILMTFNEGGGGQGMFVDITGPDGGRRTLSNNELFTFDVTGTNQVNLTTSSSIDARGGVMSLGNLAWTAGTATLGSVAGTAAFTTTTLPGAGVYNVGGAGNVQPGNITVPGNAAVTLNHTGTGYLIMNNTTTAHLQNAASVVSANGGGGVALVVDTAAAAINPLGTAVLRLGGTGGSGELIIGNKEGVDFSVTPNLQIDGDLVLAAGNVGGGAVSGTAALPITGTITNAVNYGANSLTLRSNSNYALRIGGVVSGTGALNVTGGDVTTASAVTAGAVNVSGGRLTAASSLTATSATVGKGATLRLSSSANLSGGATVNDGTLEVNGTAYAGGNITLNGGYVEAVGGINDLSGVVVNATLKAEVANALTARLYPAFTIDGAQFGTEQRLVNILTQKADFTRTLDAQALDFGPNSAGDTKIAAFFNTTAENVNTFTMSFTGIFTAQESGVHSFRETMVDDNASFWVDLNQNGFFEMNGSAGSERLANQNCCGPADPNTSVGSDATLVAGQKYNVAMVVQDTGGLGSYAAKFSTPSLSETFVQPSGQPGMWSATTGGGSVRIATDSQLVLGQASNISDAVFTGTDGVLKFNNAAARTSDIGILRDSQFGTNTVDLGANDTMNANLVVVNDGSTMIKTGAGTLNAGIIGLAAGATFEVSGGRAVMNGGVGDGFVVANGTGTAIINGTIAGAVRSEAGGTVGGAGTTGNFTLTGGTIAPGNNGVGTLTTGFLDATGGTIEIELLGRFQGDKIAATSISLISDVAISLNLGSYDPVLQGPGDFVVLENLGLDAITGLGDGTDIGGNSLLTLGGNRLAQDESFTFNGVEMKINYFGGTGNDVVLSAIPEPGTVGALLCGVGSLLSMRLRRRKS